MALAAMMLSVSPSSAAPPDLTAGGVPGNTHTTNLGLTFYEPPLKPKAEDVRKLNALIQHPDAFIPYQGFPARVGFQPDFSPPSGPAQRLFQGLSSKSKFLAVKSKLHALHSPINR